MLTTRRQALKTLAATALASTLARIPALAQNLTPSPATTNYIGVTPPPAVEPTGGPFKLPPLPYAYGDLEPMIDAETMQIHHDKHHAAYVTKLNEAVNSIKGYAATLPSNVDDLLKNLSAIPESIRTAVRNQGGGHSNHSLLWPSFSPHGGSFPPGALNWPITQTFGSFENFKTEAKKAGMGLFGSGWVWLVLDKSKKLSVMTTANQDSPLSVGKYPLFGIDVWEHAYYLKHRNVRADYIDVQWNVVDWELATKRFLDATKA
jgi:Fe-Mn family superoxide dismutase